MGYFDSSTRRDFEGLSAICDGGLCRSAIFKSADCYAHYASVVGGVDVACGGKLRGILHGIGSLIALHVAESHSVKRGSSDLIYNRCTLPCGVK